jgi:hypothetical protein
MFHFHHTKVNQFHERMHGDDEKAAKIYNCDTLRIGFALIKHICMNRAVLAKIKLQRELKFVCHGEREGRREWRCVINDESFYFGIINIWP